MLVCDCVVGYGVVLVYFFFFKQKTAYEMRISDWSSDVCSSDLPVDHLTHKCFRRGCTGGDSNRSRPVKPGEIDVRSALYQMGDATGALRHFQIGSASCRERVCQYV